MIRTREVYIPVGDCDMPFSVDYEYEAAVPHHLTGHPDSWEEGEGEQINIHALRYTAGGSEIDAGFLLDAAESRLMDVISDAEGAENG